MSQASDSESSRDGDEPDEVEAESVEGSDLSDGHECATNTPRQSILKIPKDDEKKKITKEYLRIAERIKQIQDIPDIREGVGKLSVSVKRADQLYCDGGVGTTETAPLDASVMMLTSNVTNKFVKIVQIDSRLFDITVFAEKLLTAVSPSARASQLSDEEDEDRRIQADPSDWIEFGERFSELANRSLPPFQFMHGTFDVETQPRIPQQRNPRAKKGPEEQQVKPNQVDLTSKDGEESAPKEVENIYKVVRKLYKKNGQQPMNFFQVNVDPESFSQTVENIFHSTFLVKDGKLGVSKDEDNEPVLEPIEDDNPNNDGEGIQSIISFSMDDWDKWKERYEISRAAIPKLK